MPPKVLPSQPSLLQLKRQAKELLRAYRLDDTVAVKRMRASLTDAHTHVSLHDAQGVLAREYGFASWAKLKRHVETLLHHRGHNMSDVLQQFIRAADRGNVEETKTLLEQHADLHTHLDEPLLAFDTPPLVHNRNNREMVDLLLDYGADINVKGQWWAGGQGVLHAAEPKMVDYLISRGAEIDVHAAARIGMLDRVKELIEADPSLVNAKGPDGQRPLHFAAAPEIIDYLLENGADINARCVDHESTAAQYAVGKTERCRYLIEKGADVDIFMACILGNLDLVKQVVEADPDCVNGHTPQGFSKDESGDGYIYPPTPDNTSAHIYVWQIGLNMTPHMVALRHSHDAIHAYLLEHSSPLRRLIDACIRAEQRPMEQILISHPGLDLTLSKKDGGVLFGRGFYEYYHNTGFDVAASILASIDAGFRLTAHAEMGGTPLHWAAWYGCEPAVVTLIEQEAPIEAEDGTFGSTPLQWAIHGSIHGHHSYGDHYAIVERLLNAGVRTEGLDRPTGDSRIDALLEGK
jgi:ankyrin repeat protein